MIKTKKPVKAKSNKAAKAASTTTAAIRLFSSEWHLQAKNQEPPPVKKLAALLTEDRFEMRIAQDARFYVIGDHHLVLHSDRAEAFEFYMISVLAEAATQIRCDCYELPEIFDADKLPSYCRVDESLQDKLHEVLERLRANGAQIWSSEQHLDLFAPETGEAQAA